MARNERHVVRRDDGWAVAKPDARRASSVHDTQAEAIARGRQIVGRAGGGELVIHDRAGRIRDLGTIRTGHDPLLPRDTR